MGPASENAGYDLFAKEVSLYRKASMGPASENAGYSVPAGRGLAAL